MKFRTELHISKENYPIKYDSKIVLYGSCFTENIENYLNYFKFQNISNSHGILFHPKAIEKAIIECINKKEYDKTHLQNFNDLWMSFNHHSKFSSVDLHSILQQINQKIKASHNILKNATHIIITLGTSWVYTYSKLNLLVANCHKIPQNKFKKQLLGIDEITLSLNSMVSKIYEFNANAKILFTVSPVRHLKDGHVENSQSKAHLLAAIHRVIDNRKAFYFPSYEIMIDDLRDYRFYKNDMLHPNETAVAYIWDIFKNTWISESSFDLMDQVESIQRSLQHKPFHPFSKKHQLFLNNLDKKMEALSKKFPQIRFDR